ncbi:MAG: hypothetical protein JRE28_04680 [Deltaproteobacteria bacterium]|nr:hypothetical protein [Deltaproteobacteria bacterium]
MQIVGVVDLGPFSLAYDYTYYANGLKRTFTGPDGQTLTYYYAIVAKAGGLL